MAITLEAIRAAGGIVHSDGNIFFRDVSMLQGLAGAAPAAVAPQADLDADLGLTVDQRDTAEGWADGLAGLIGKYFGRDIGEHSSAHCPWQEAKDIIEEAEPYQPAAVTGPAWGEQQVHALAIHMAASAPPSHKPRDYDADMAWARSALGFIAGHAQAAPALEAPAAPAVPAGFALVPIEPTQQMLDAGRWSGAGSVSIQEEWARKEMWSRMLATITPPPAAYADDLIALVTELVQALRKAAPDNDLAGHALDYLKRNGLQGSPLRAAEAAPQAPAAPAEAVTPPVIDERAMKEAFDSATAEGKSFNDALRAAACATIWKRAARSDGAPNAVPAAMSAIATECALHAEERHSYLPNTPAQAATWRPHDWVLQAMSRAISFDRMMNQAAPAAPAVDASTVADMARALEMLVGSDALHSLCEDCGLAFCGEHLGSKCERCINDEPAFPAKPESQEWLQHLRTDPSWAKWRKENEAQLTAWETAAQRAQAQQKGPAS